MSNKRRRMVFMRRLFGSAPAEWRVDLQAIDSPQIYKISGFLRNVCISWERRMVFMRRFFGSVS